jgi:hypothetical protein
MVEQNPKPKMAKVPEIIAIKLLVYFEAKTYKEKSRRSAIKLQNRTANLLVRVMLGR